MLASSCKLFSFCFVALSGNFRDFQIILLIEICLTLLDNQHLSKYRPLLKSRPKGSTEIETYELHKMISVLILHIGCRAIMKWTNRHGLE